jgi:hypothetical protein
MTALASPTIGSDPRYSPTVYWVSLVKRYLRFPFGLDSHFTNGVHSPRRLRNSAPSKVRLNMVPMTNLDQFSSGASKHLRNRFRTNGRRQFTWSGNDSSSIITHSVNDCNEVAVDPIIPDDSAWVTRSQINCKSIARAFKKYAFMRTYITNDVETYL